MNPGLSIETSPRKNLFDQGMKKKRVTESALDRIHQEKLKLKIEKIDAQTKIADK